MKSGTRFSTPGVRVELVDLPDGLGVEPGAAVGQVVAGDAGDGGVAQTHRADALGDPARLVAVEGLRAAGVDLAEVAAPGALVAADEEGRLAVLPALVDVGAAGFLADRVQPLALDEVAQSRCTPGPSCARVRIHSGLRSIGTSALRCSMRSMRRPSGWMVVMTRGPRGSAERSVRSSFVRCSCDDSYDGVEVALDEREDLGDGDVAAEFLGEGRDGGVGDAAREPCWRRTAGPGRS